jgi:uncharacterized protein YbaA (DUF1428 family)
MPYFDYCLFPVPTEKLDAYKAFSQRMAEVHRSMGLFTSPTACWTLNRTMARSFTPMVQEAKSRAQNCAIFPPQRPPVSENRHPVLDRVAEQSRARRAVAADPGGPGVQPRDDEELIFEGARLVAGGFFKLLKTWIDVPTAKQKTRCR